MGSTLWKYGGCAVTGMVLAFFAAIMEGREAKSLIAEYSLSSAQVSVMKFCRRDLNRTDMSYYAGGSDMAVCGCIADKLRISEQFQPSLEQAMKDYKTYRGNPAVTGESLAKQMHQSIRAGTLPASALSDVNRFGGAYLAAENACLGV